MKKEEPAGPKEKMKKKKPDFTRQNSVKKRIGNKWRKPKGIQSKMRLKHRGYVHISRGYGSPKATRGLSPEGKSIRHVYNLNDLEKADKEKETLIISKTVGMKKKAVLVKKAMEKGLSLLNIKDAESYLKEVENMMKKRAEKKSKIKEKRKTEEKKKREEKAEKEKKEQPKEKDTTEEEKAEKEKKEKDKLLAKKDIK